MSAFFDGHRAQKAAGGLVPSFDGRPVFCATTRVKTMVVHHASRQSKHDIRFVCSQSRKLQGAHGRVQQLITVPAFVKKGIIWGRNKRETLASKDSSTGCSADTGAPSPRLRR